MPEELAAELVVVYPPGLCHCVRRDVGHLEGCSVRVVGGQVRQVRGGRPVPGDLRRSGRVDDGFGPEHDRLRRVAVQVPTDGGGWQGRVALGVVQACTSLQGQDGAPTHSAGF